MLDELYTQFKTAVLAYAPECTDFELITDEDYITLEATVCVEGEPHIAGDIVYDGADDYDGCPGVNHWEINARPADNGNKDWATIFDLFLEDVAGAITVTVSDDWLMNVFVTLPQAQRVEVAA